jgi:hypothetical protein
MSVSDPPTAEAILRDGFCSVVLEAGALSVLLFDRVALSGVEATDLVGRLVILLAICVDAINGLAAAVDFGLGPIMAKLSLGGMLNS